MFFVLHNQCNYKSGLFHHNEKLVKEKKKKLCAHLRGKSQEPGAMVLPESLHRGPAYAALQSCMLWPCCGRLTSVRAPRCKRHDDSFNLGNLVKIHLELQPCAALHLRWPFSWCLRDAALGIGELCVGCSLPGNRGWSLGSILLLCRRHLG